MTLDHDIMCQTNNSPTNEMSIVMHIGVMDHLTEDPSHVHYLLPDGNPIRWSSKKQSVIIKSTIEVESYAIVDDICKVLSVKSFLNKMHIK